MAIIHSKGKGRKRLLLAGVSGHIGKTLVVKQYKGKIVISNFPARSRKKPTKAQKAQRMHFQDAVAYAKEIISDPLKKNAYSRKLKGNRTVFQAALSEYLKRKSRRCRDASQTPGKD
jgi:hypothetical protein